MKKGINISKLIRCGYNSNHRKSDETANVHGIKNIPKFFESKNIQLKVPQFVPYHKDSTKLTKHFLNALNEVSLESLEVNQQRRQNTGFPKNNYVKTNKSRMQINIISSSDTKKHPSEVSKYRNSFAVNSYNRIFKKSCDVVRQLKKRNNSPTMDKNKQNQEKLDLFHDVKRRQRDINAQINSVETRADINMHSKKIPDIAKQKHGNNFYNISENKVKLNEIIQNLQVVNKAQKGSSLEAYANLNNQIQNNQRKIGKSIEKLVEAELSENENEFVLNNLSGVAQEEMHKKPCGAAVESLPFNIDCYPNNQHLNENLQVRCGKNISGDDEIVLEIKEIHQEQQKHRSGSVPSTICINNNDEELEVSNRIDKENLPKLAKDSNYICNKTNNQEICSKLDNKSTNLSHEKIDEIEVKSIPECSKNPHIFSNDCIEDLKLVDQQQQNQRSHFLLPSIYINKNDEETIENENPSKLANDTNLIHNDLNSKNNYSKFDSNLIHSDQQKSENKNNDLGNFSKESFIGNCIEESQLTDQQQKQYYNYEEDISLIAHVNPSNEKTIEKFTIKENEYILKSFDGANDYTQSNSNGAFQEAEENKQQQIQTYSFRKNSELNTNSSSPQKFDESAISYEDNHISENKKIFLEPREYKHNHMKISLKLDTTPNNTNNSNSEGKSSINEEIANYIEELQVTDQQQKQNHNYVEDITLIAHENTNNEKTRQKPNITENENLLESFVAINDYTQSNSNKASQEAEENKQQQMFKNGIQKNPELNANSLSSQKFDDAAIANEEMFLEPREFKHNQTKTNGFLENSSLKLDTTPNDTNTFNSEEKSSINEEIANYIEESEVTDQQQKQSHNYIEDIALIAHENTNKEKTRQKFNIKENENRLESIVGINDYNQSNSNGASQEAHENKQPQTYTNVILKNLELNANSSSSQNFDETAISNISEKKDIFLESRELKHNQTKTNRFQEYLSLKLDTTPNKPNNLNFEEKNSMNEEIAVPNITGYGNNLLFDDLKITTQQQKPNTFSSENTDCHTNNLHIQETDVNEPTTLVKFSARSEDVLALGNANEEIEESNPSDKSNLNDNTNNPNNNKMRQTFIKEEQNVIKLFENEKHFGESDMKMPQESKKMNQLQEQINSRLKNFATNVNEKAKISEAVADKQMNYLSNKRTQAEEYYNSLKTIFDETQTELEEQKEQVEELAPKEKKNNKAEEAELRRFVRIEKEEKDRKECLLRSQCSYIEEKISLSGALEPWEEEFLKKLECEEARQKAEAKEREEELREMREVVIMEEENRKKLAKERKKRRKLQNKESQTKTSENCDDVETFYRDIY